MSIIKDEFNDISYLKLYYDLLNLNFQLKNYYLDFIMEALKISIKIKMEDLFLYYIIPYNILIPDYPIESNEYSNLFKDIFLFDRKEWKENTAKNFYFLLLYFRANYEKDKIEDLLSREELWNYYRAILKVFYLFFPNIELPKKFMNHLLGQEPLSFDIIQRNLFFIKPMGEKLILINKNSDEFYEIMKKEKIDLDYQKYYEIKKEKGIRITI